MKEPKVMKIANTPRRSAFAAKSGFIITKSVPSRPAALKRAKPYKVASITISTETSPASRPHLSPSKHSMSPSNGHHAHPHHNNHHHHKRSQSRHITNGASHPQYHPTHQRSANLINHHATDKYLYTLRGKGSKNGSTAYDKLSGSSGASPPSSLTRNSLNATATSDMSGRTSRSKDPASGSDTSAEKPDAAAQRFLLIQTTLIVANVLALCAGIAGLIVAGFVDPRPLYKVDTLGGQLSLVSVYMIMTSLIGLYGARRESVTLLVLYAILLVGALFCRSVFYFVASFVSSGTPIALSMLAAFLEVILILFAFALAAEVRIKKLASRKEQEHSHDSVCKV